MGMAFMIHGSLFDILLFSFSSIGPLRWTSPKNRRISNIEPQNHEVV